LNRFLGNSGSQLTHLFHDDRYKTLDTPNPSYFVTNITKQDQEFTEKMIMTERLKDKVAFITGGNSGIGFASARAFVEQGATVAILARSQEKADAARAGIGGNTSSIIGDVTDLDSLKRAYETVKERHGRIDIVVANAGVAPPTPFGDVEPAAFDRIFDVNVKGSFFTVQYALPLLAKGASVILVSSCLNEMGMEGFSIYNASKAAMRSLARSLTLDLAKVGARINVLSPGPIVTPALKNGGLSPDQIETQYSAFSNVLAAGRVGQPEEMAAVAVFLASDDSSYMYGSEIQADGGMNQTRWPKQ
jgi:NAD(P)-dependent dehydrogenase (short-subunit alcohol dehydrogenase family)